MSRRNRNRVRREVSYRGWFGERRKDVWYEDPNTGCVTAIVFLLALLWLFRGC